MEFILVPIWFLSSRVCVKTHKHLKTNLAIPLKTFLIILFTVLWPTVWIVSIYLSVICFKLGSIGGYFLTGFFISWAFGVTIYQVKQSLSEYD